MGGAELPPEPARGMSEGIVRAQGVGGFALLLPTSDQNHTDCTDTAKRHMVHTFMH